MKKALLFAGILFCIANAVKAQTASSTATQTVNLNLSNAIEITFSGNGTATGAAVNFAFNTVNDFANGIESGAQELKIKANKKFNVSVKTNASIFSYSGATTPAPQMLVYNTLSTMVTANSTGGTIPMPFSTSNYYNLTSTATNIITNGNAGGAQTFAVKYKADPGFSFPAGTYTVDVVYTATQL